MPPKKSSGSATCNGAALHAQPGKDCSIQEAIAVETPPPDIQTGAVMSTTAKEHVEGKKLAATTIEETDPPMTGPTNARDQLMKAIEMLKTQHTSGQNLIIKNAVIAMLEDLAPTNQTLTFSPPPRKSVEDQRITNVENDMKEIKETMHEMKAMLAANKPLWSAIAASPPTKAESTRTQAQLEIAKRERLEQARQERAKTAVTLTFRNASESEQTVLKNRSESEYTAIFQRAIKESNAKDITIRKLQKLPGKLLKIHCHNEDDAKQLREVEWEKTITGVTLASQEYGVVLNGVPINILNARTASQNDMRELIQATNDIDVERVAPLMRNPRNPDAPTQSIIIYTKSLKKANEAIEDGILIERKNKQTHEIEGRRYPAKRYNPQHRIKQCFRCQAYGHKAETCTRTMICGRCAQEHETRTCTVETNKCTHCSDAHPAWHHKCPRRIKEHEKLQALIMTTPLLFPC